MGAGDLETAYQAGEAIVREGEVGDCMYMLLSGDVQVVKARPGGEISLTNLGQGAVFGEMALFTRSPRSATVRALRNARVLKLSRRDFLRRAHQDPVLAFSILQQMSSRIQAMSAELVRLKGQVEAASSGTPAPAG